MNKITEKIITIKFIEPYRLIERHDKQNLNAKSFLRGYSFARWHKDKNTGLGRPYITGTLVRSAVIKAAEELLWLRDGKLLDGTSNETVCCCGEFKNSKAKVSREDGLNVKRLRRRQTLSWGNKEMCHKDSNAPCPFCLLLGRCDKADSKTDDPLKRDVNFFNFSITNNDRLLFNIKDIADNRVINRVDQQSGKAEDFFNIWEVDHNLSMEFSGKISLSEKASNSKALLSLIEDSLVLVNKIAGGLCFLTMKDSGTSFKEDNGSARSASNTSSNLYKNSTEPETIYNDQINRWAEEIAKAFKESDKLAHLRLFADTVRDLRRLNEEKLDSLPKGHIDNLDKVSDHFIWDIKIEKNKKLRIWIKDRYNDFKSYHPSWKSFCELLGGALYSKAKDLAPEQFSSTRPLGAAQSIQIAEETRYLPGKTSQGPRYEWLIKGDLVAMTPFYFGRSTENEQTAHTDMHILTDKNGHFRIPRSALRGILRRDLQIALGTGCRAELGQKQPCMCPVCSLLKKITIKDSFSEYKKPPRTRPRIRMDHKKGTVSKSALFELEVGPRGVVFPFELRFRTTQKKLPDALENILSWWQEKDEKKGLAFLSGQAGTGKGRFGLTNLNYKQWDLKKDWTDYKTTYGGRKEILDLEVLELSSTADAPWKLFNNAEVLVSSPFITKDPVMSLIDSSGTDAVCYKSVYLDENGDDKEEYLLKGESFRGILRTAVGRREKDKDGKTDLLTREHEDCECILCSLFGNEHEAGKVRIEDLLIQGTSVEKLIDRIAIDRFTGGAKDKNKFDLRALVGTPKKPLLFKGNIWINTELTSDECNVLGRALQDIHEGLYPLGGLGNEGYGWVSYNPCETNSSQMVKPEPFELMQDIMPVLDENKTYWPKYFLPFGEIKVKRTNTPPSHAYIQDDPLTTGKIVCTLTTKTPLIIADSAVESQDENGHKTYKFFNLNIGGSENMCIPGSEIKGMASSVFEALTNSCLRVFDEKKRLSWRMEAENLGEWKAGMITGEGKKIKRFRRMASVPVYDDPKAFFDKFDDDEIGGGKPVTLFVKKLKAAFNIPKNDSDGWNEEEGYLFVTYPNKIEFYHKKPNDDIKNFVKTKGLLPDVPSDLKDVKINFIRDADGKKEKIFCCWDRKEKEINYYIMAKYREMFFYKLNSNEKDIYEIPKTTLDKYFQLWSDYTDNPQAVPEKIFQSRVHKTLKDGDLVYFYPDDENKVVTDIIPVRISRIVDDDVLGQKFLNNRDDLRPCVREILDNETAIKIKDAGLKEIYQHHPDGLCPACSIFGTTFYKGRVGFGFAYPEADAVEVKKITLPLQERPRHTWAIPHKKSCVPGRGIYVHHQGWEKYWNNPSKEATTQNNRTVYVVEPEQKFTFEIKFENLKNWELGLLIYSLQLEPAFANKLGMGKAIGFGSVKIDVQNIHLINGDINPTLIKEEALSKLKKIWLGKDNNTVSDIELIKKLRPLFELLYYNTKNEIKVTYPKLKKENPSEPDGYVELAKGEFASENRQKKLTTPWSHWV